MVKTIKFRHYPLSLYKPDVVKPCTTHKLDSPNAHKWVRRTLDELK